MQTVAKSFADALSTYNEHALPQAEFAARLVSVLAQHVDSNKPLKNVLEIGCGTGFLSKEIIKHFNVDTYYANDIVSECDELINTLHPKLRFLPGNIKDITLPKGLDLVCSSSTLQWVENTQELIDNLHNSLKTGGILAISSFSSDHFLELRNALDKADVKQKPMAYLSQAQWQTILAGKFDILSIETSKQTIHFDDFHKLLLHLRNTGVNGNRLEAIQPNKLRKISDFYLKSSNKTLPLSYQPIQIIGRKR